MNRTHHDMARETFVLATTLLEDAHQIATAGQSPGITGDEITRYAHELQQLAEELRTISDFLHCISRQEMAHTANKSG